jgi:hypothetical protein
MQSHFAQLGNMVHDSSRDPGEANDSPETAS